MINQSLVGAVLEAQKYKQIKNIYGALHGIKGILEENLIDLGKETPRVLELVANTPSSALGTVRKKPTRDECKQIFKNLKKHSIKYFFYIGGNDSAEAAMIINEYAETDGFDVCCVHIPKTIDNDLRENDHTPGYGTAAKFVACAFMGDNLDNRALPGVKINVVMGRHAGFLTAASALGRLYPDDGPHLVYVPERSFSMTRFIDDVRSVYGSLGRCLVAVSEGISDSKGVPIVSKFMQETDSHGNVQLSGTGALGDLLAAAVREQTNITRVRADTLGYLQRSFPGVVSERDSKEARAVGVAAVREAIHTGEDGSIAVRRRPGRKYQIYLKMVPLNKVARDTRHMPPRFINESGNNVTGAFANYANPIVGDLPPIGRFRDLVSPKPR